ncbi:acyl carrier protein [Desulfatibacillum aliphaticivorans]|uniref:Acyl carrier protein n=1 Tax=Desulfatibacillum aliphaticivorans TaxID=218208 RepID=B8FFP1_DESAL|nr:phosphopantetheine-binding protein [Desulfatibacillum aliphaticivorans]ACL03446.1 acyl carrier protein [Desulfatibacillum aliphaticivorans]
MELQQVFDKMVEILKPFVKDPAALANADKDTHLIDDLKVNSARMVDIIIESEDAFEVEIDDDEADSIETIGDAVRVIMGKMDPVTNPS